MNKRITNLSIKGLNTSMPDSIVPDGACDVLTNMRFRDGSWQSMGNIAQVAKIPLPDIGVTLSKYVSFVGIHEVEGKEHYICKCIIGLGGDNYELHLCVYHDSKWEDLGTISTHNTTSKLQKMVIRVTSFGNVLIVRSDDKMQHYIWNEGKYSLFTMPKPVEISESETVTLAESDKGTVSGYHFWHLMDDAKNIMRPVNNGKNNEWWGEVCYLVAYRMKDGSILSPSGLHILCSEGQDTDFNYSTMLVGCCAYTIDDKKKKYYSAIVYDDVNPNLTAIQTNRFRTFKPSISVKVPDGVDIDIIDRVALYSTRVNNILDYDKMTVLLSDIIYDLNEGFYNVKEINLSQFYADNKLPNQPMYLVDEINIADIKDGVWNVELGYDKLKDLTTKVQRYEPVQMHAISAESMYDYNARMHYGCITNTLYSHQPQMALHYASDTPDSIVRSVEMVTFADISAVAISESLITTFGGPDNILVNVPSIISYPDYRATSLSVIELYDNAPYGANNDFKFNLQAATANNFAYYIFPPTTEGKYAGEHNIVAETPFYSPIAPVRLSSTFYEPNRIQVSAPNNPFSLPFENSYAVGNEGSRVVAMNTVADSLVDSNFYGNYPLYIFTTDGIFALRSGSGEVLYAGTEIVNHDKLINPNTIALNGSVVYACTEGLKALTGRQGVRISADIDPLAWDGAQFGINWEYGELLCRLSSGEVYVWNVGANVWSQREDITGHIKDGYIGQPTQKDGILIYDINKENEGEINIKLQTRPLKFDSLGFKKIDSLIARLASINANVWNIKVESSNDCQQWHMIKWVTTQGLTSDIGLRRFGPSARFYRLTIEGTVKGKVAFTQIDMTIQDRYNNKLR